MTAEAEAAAPGAGGLLFMPYLAGEPLGQHRNARAQFFGLGAGHGRPAMLRAVMEGVAFAAARHLRIMEGAAGRPVERVIASGGGAKTALWLAIKASVYGVPILVPAEAECGILGCAAMVQTATGRSPDLAAAADRLVRIAAEVQPDPTWRDRYAAAQPVFDRLYRHSQALYDDLDPLAAEPRIAP